jgi:hypothetical protein
MTAEPLNRLMVEDLIRSYQEQNTDPETTTVDAGIVLLSQEETAIPLISVKETQPHCDVAALTILLDKRTEQGDRPVGKVFYKASENIAEAWTVPYPGYDTAASLREAKDLFQKQANKEKIRWNQAKRNK